MLSMLRMDSAVQAQDTRLSVFALKALVTAFAICGPQKRDVLYQGHVPHA